MPRLLTATCLLILLFPCVTIAQNVGIGLDVPSSRLHLHQPNVLFDPISQLHLTNGATGFLGSDGIKLSSIISDGRLMNYENGALHFGTNGLNRMSIRNDGRIGINTLSTLGASDLTIRSFSASGYGGMYLESPDGANGKPFYGYATNGTPRMWHFFDETTDTWRLNFGGDKLILNALGQLAIGYSAPSQKLSVDGKIEIGNDAVTPTEGSIRWDGSDFEGYNGADWKSFTSANREDILSYDEYFTWEPCAIPDTTLIQDGYVISLCGKIFDTGGSTGNYGINEDFTLAVDSGEDPLGYGRYAYVVINMLDLEPGVDSLFLIGKNTQYVLTAPITTPDTFILTPSVSQEFKVRFKSNNSNPGGPYDGFEISYYWAVISVPEVDQNSGFYFNAATGSVAGGVGVAYPWEDFMGYAAVSFGVEAKASDQGIALGKLANASKLNAIAIGTSSSSTGFRAIAIGNSSLASGTHAVALGRDSYASNLEAVAIGYGTWASGQGAVAIAPYSNALGFHSIAIGQSALVDEDDAIAMGYAATNHSENSIVIGASTIASIGGYQNWSNLSDGRFKTNVQENIPGLLFINGLRPVTYQLDIPVLQAFLNVSLDRDPGREDAADQIRTGFIAQEVEQLAASIDYPFSGVFSPKDDDDHYSLRYAEFVVPLVKAVQELSVENADLLERLSKLEATVQQLLKG
jgi:hypothetical protein